MRKVSEIKLLPVLSIADGANVEKVSRVAINPTTKKIEYLAFAGTPWYEPQAVLHWSKVRAVGKDMLTIKSRKDIGPVNEELRRTLGRTMEIIGLDAIDSSGRILGVVADLIVDETAGELRKIVLNDGTALDVASVVTIGAAVITEGSAAEEEAAPAFSENDFLLGKITAQDIADEQGNVIIAAGTVISDKEIEAAKAGGALYDLVTGVK